MIGEIEVIARRDESAWVPVENPEKLFPRSGTIEVRGVDTRQLKPGDWVVFQITPRVGRGLWKASQYRRLYQFKDLAEKGSMDEIHRCLAIEGLSGADAIGPWAIRVSKDSIVQVELIRSGQVAVLASGTSQVLAYEFEPSRFLTMPLHGKTVELYDFDQEAHPREVHDWSLETNYILRVIRALRIASTEEVARITAWLEIHAQRAGDRLSLDRSDLVAAHEAVRSGSLAKRLIEDGGLLRDLVDSIQKDGRIRDLLERCARDVAEEERASIRHREADRLETVLREREQSCLSRLEEKMRAVEEVKNKEIEVSLATRQREIEESLALRSEQGRQDLEESLGRQRRLLAEEIESISSERLAIEDRMVLLTEEVSKLEARATDLSKQRAEVSASLDQLLAAHSLAKEKRLVQDVRSPISSPRVKGKRVTSDELKILLQKVPLLTEHGRDLMQRFFVLLLAGDVPVLCGPDVNAFLRIAEVMLSSGWSAVLEADPTMIAFEDVWTRPGSSAPTVLAQALYLAGQGEETTCLAVIKNIEHSGARFWFPTLALRSRKSEFPRRLLLAATISDIECEEAVRVSEHAVLLEISSALEGLAPQMAPLLLRSESSHELDPGDSPELIQVAAQVTSSLGDCMDLDIALRCTRVAAEASRLAVGDDQERIVNSMIEFFLNDSRTKAMTKSSNGGGSSHA